MAIAFVAASQNDTASTSTTVTTGAVTDGHLMYAFVFTNSSATAAITAPAGWTGDVEGQNPNGNNFKTFYKVASSEGTTQVFSCSDASRVWAVVGVYSGVDTGTPLDVASPAEATGTVNTITVPNITTTTDNAWHLAFVWDLAVGSYPSNPSGYTQDFQAWSSVQSLRVSHKAITPAGAVTSVTGAVAGGGSGLWNGLSVALRPAGGGGGTFFNPMTGRGGAAAQPLVH